MGVSVAALVLAASGGAYAAATDSSPGTRPIPLISLHNGKSRRIVDIAGVGKLVASCAEANSLFTYTNESSVSQNYVLMDASTTANDSGGEPDTGTVPAGRSFKNPNNDPHDLIRLSVSNGTGVADVVLAESRRTLLDCLYWGEAYSG